MACRVILAMLYHSLQRASSSIANLTNKRHFMDIQYMTYKDAKMEIFLDECIRRIALVEDLSEKDVEGTLQTQLMHSKELEVQMTAYLKLPQSQHHSENLLDMMTEQCEIREVLRRNKYEDKLVKEGFAGKDTARDPKDHNPGRSLVS